MCVYLSIVFCLFLQKNMIFNSWKSSTVWNYLSIFESKNKLDFSQTSVSVRQQWKYSRYNSLWNPRLRVGKDLQGHAWTWESSRETREFCYIFLSSITIIETNFIWELKVINPSYSHNFLYCEWWVADF